ncbi:MAG: 5-oxoprolinase subunit PxpB [Bacteroidota bacterium]
MKSYPITVTSFGKRAVLMQWPEQVEEAILKDVLQFESFLKKKLGGDWEYVPAYNSLTVINNIADIDFGPLRKDLLIWYAEIEGHEQNNRFLWKLPVCYDLDFAIDLKEVAKQLRLTNEQLVRLHTSIEYTVYGIGFLPGFMYLGGLPGTLITQRKKEPRLKVVQGAVGLAGKQTGIYPQESPGGWNIIGNCPVPLFNKNHEDPSFVRVGDKVKFFQISKAAHDLHRIEIEVGIFKPQKTILDD